jgi:hypothetical protein
LEKLTICAKEDEVFRENLHLLEICGKYEWERDVTVEFFEKREREDYT